jgi:hypothetical protein
LEHQDPFLVASPTHRIQYSVQAPAPLIWSKPAGIDVGERA